jgi:hypothetical protein
LDFLLLSLTPRSNCSTVAEQHLLIINRKGGSNVAEYRLLHG